MFRPSLRPMSSRPLTRRYLWVSLMAGLGGTAIGGCAAEEPAKAGLASGCSINSDCNDPLVCSFQKCHVGCRESSDCDNGGRCVVGTGGGVCVLDHETSCSHTTDCPPGLFCAADDQCRNECKSARDCAGNQVCTPSGSCADTSEVNAMGELRGAGDAGTSLGGGGAGGSEGKGDSGSPNVGGFGNNGGAPVSGTDAGPRPPMGGFGGSGGFDPGNAGAGGFKPGCGMANMPCCPPNEQCTDTSTVCVFGMCQACGSVGSRCCMNDVCDSGGTCDNGTCVACGALSQPCCGGQCTGALSCISGTCDVACSPPLVANQGSCTLPPPRPVAPISGSFMNTRHPKLSWALPSGITTAHVQVCKDRACSNVLFETDAGTNTTVSTALPQGIAFWRLSSVVAGDAGAGSASYGPVWQMLVGGAHDAPISTAWGIAPDFNGDGFSDALVRANTTQGGDMRVYAGTASGLSSTPVTISTGGAGIRGGIPLGDFDGDGYTDLALQEGPGFGVHRGSPSGLSLVASQQINSGVSPDQLEQAADVNGDGYSDLIVPSTIRDVDGNEFLVVGVFSGGKNGLSNTSTSFTSTVLRQGPSGNSETADVNGDGYADLLIATEGSSNVATIAVFFGSPSGFNQVPQIRDVALSGPPELLVTTAGDVNGDGYVDVLVLTGNGMLQFLGTASGLAVSPPSATLPGSAAGGPGPGSSQVLAVGDANGDGYSDVVGVSNQQTIVVYFGSSSGLSSGSSQALTPPAPPNFTVSMANVTALAGIGDVNGDGYGDIGQGVEWTSTTQIRSNRTYVWHGGAPIPSAPSTTLSVSISAIR
jgi:hypothetical protein